MLQNLNWKNHDIDLALAHEPPPRHSLVTNQSLNKPRQGDLTSLPFRLPSHVDFAFIILLILHGIQKLIQNIS